MSAQGIIAYDYLLDVDRVVNEGLGGGYINSEYKAKQLEVY